MCLRSNWILAFPFAHFESILLNEHSVTYRSIGAEYKESIVYKGIHSFSYSAGFGDMSTDPELKCFCTTPDTCMKKGVHDLTRCAGKTLRSANSAKEKLILGTSVFRLIRSLEYWQRVLWSKSLAFPSHNSLTRALAAWLLWFLHHTQLDEHAR